MKSYASRSSATQFLKKIGVSTKDYNLFITKTLDGYEVDDVEAKKHVKSSSKSSQTKSGAKKKSTAKKKAPAKKKSAAKKKASAGKKSGSSKSKASSENRVSVSARCQELIRKGKTNEQIWEVIREEFGLDETKKYYPAWNRSDMRRRGLLEE